ncbi:MAG: hypothetical protein WEE89_15000 [Gemmatimonadota bacterium]
MTRCTVLVRYADAQAPGATVAVIRDGNLYRNDGADRITGFIVSNGRTRGVRFEVMR